MSCERSDIHKHFENIIDKCQSIVNRLIKGTFNKMGSDYNK